MRLRWPRSILARLLACILLLIVLLAVLAPPILAHVFRTRLASAIAKGLGARLTARRATYRFPFGVSLVEPRIVLDGPSGESIELFSADRAVLVLSRLPRKNQPVEVQRVALLKPSIRLTHIDHMWEVATPDSIVGKAERHELPRSKKPPSQAFHLHDLSLRNVTVIFDDRGPASLGQVTLLQNLNVEIGASGRSGATYQFRAWGSQSSPMNTVATVDLDHRTADVSTLDWNVPLTPVIAASESARPNPAWSGANLTGSLKISGMGHLDLANVRNDSFNGSVALQDGSAFLPRWKLKLAAASAQVEVQVTPNDSSSAKSPNAMVEIRSVALQGTGVTLQMRGGQITAGPEGAWRLEHLLGTLAAAESPSASIPENDAIGKFAHTARLAGRIELTATAHGPMRLPHDEADLADFHWQMLGYPRQVAFVPKKFSIPFDHVGGGSIEVHDGVVTLKHLIGRYGNDEYLLDGARLLLLDPSHGVHLSMLRREIRFTEIGGTVVFHQPATPYPGGFGKFMAQVRPQGPFAVGQKSWVAFKRRLPGEAETPKSQYMMHVLSETGNFQVGPRIIPMTTIRGDATVTREKINLIEFGADVLGGTVVARGAVFPAKPIHYDGYISLSNIDLAKLAAQFRLQEPKHGKFVGHGFANAHLWTEDTTPTTQSATKPLERLAADGQFEVFGGDFYSFPILGNVVDQVRRKDALTVGEAAGTFVVAGEVISLKQAVIDSPALGLSGSGTIDFQRNLNLQAVAAPLGDWGDKFRQAHIPVVSDVAGGIAGALQKVFNAAEGWLLFDIHITGTTRVPQIKTVPAPLLTDSVAALFGQMIQPDKDPHHLLNSINGPAKH